MVVHYKVSMMLFLLLALGILQTTQAVCDCGSDWTIQQCSVEFPEMGQCSPPQSFQAEIPSAPANHWTTYFENNNKLGLEVVFTSPQDNAHLARIFDVSVMAMDYPVGFDECFRVTLEPGTHLEANQTFHLQCLNNINLVPRQAFQITIQPYPTDPGFNNRLSYVYRTPGCQTIGSVGDLCDDYGNPETWVSRYIRVEPDSCGGTCVKVLFDTYDWPNDNQVSTYRISICGENGKNCLEENSKYVDCKESLDAGIPMCNTTFYNLDPDTYKAKQQIDQITPDGLYIRGDDIKTTSFIITDPGVPEIIGKPKDITVHVSATNESVSVSWKPPTVSNYHQSKVNLSSNYAPGDNFTVGVWTVTYMAEDYFKHRKADEASFTISIVGPPAPPIYSASPISFEENHKLMIGGIAGGASALLLLLFILILKKSNLFKKNSDECSVSSDGRPSQTPTESTDPTINDRGNLVRNSQIIHGSYDNGLCFPDGSGSQYPAWDDEEFKNVVDKVSLNGQVFGPTTQPNHFVNTNQYMPKVTVNCNITAGPNHFDGEQQTTWVSTCVENEPRLRSIEPEPVVHIKKDFGYGRLDSCDSGIGEYPSTDIQSITQVSFTDEL